MIERKPTHKTFKPRHEYKGFRRPQLSDLKRPEHGPGFGLKRQSKGRLRAGPRMKEWDRAWRFLKPRLEAAGRTSCEFDFIPHVCSDILTPAHSKKRRLMVDADVYTVALACSTVHRILDEVLSHEAMEKTVLMAIERNGGLILPEAKAA